MKAFLERNGDGLFYQQGGTWNTSLEHALMFASTHEAEEFRVTQQIEAAHAVIRPESSLMARFRGRAPGAYQAGE